MGTPTITMAFNMEIIHWADAIINVTDTGGNEAWLRPLWKHHFPNKQALVLVVDSTDDVRMGNPTDVPDPGGGQAPTASGLLKQLLAEPLLLPAGTVLILANKQDAAGCLNVETVRERLGADEVFARARRQWRILGSSAMSGEGLDEGFKWLL